MSNKRKIKYYINVIIWVLFVFGAIITIIEVSNKTYFNNYKNYISLKRKDKYMIIDTLLIDEFYYHHTDNTGYNVVKGVLLSDDSRKKVTFGKEEYFTCLAGYKDKKVSVYKSKLTNDIYLKDSKKGYYREEYFNVIGVMTFKVLFFLIPIVYILIFIKKRVYENK